MARPFMFSFFLLDFSPNLITIVGVQLFIEYMSYNFYSTLSLSNMNKFQCLYSKIVQNNYDGCIIISSFT